MIHFLPGKQVGSFVICDHGALASGESFTARLIVKIQAGTEGQTISNTATYLSSIPRDITPDSDTVSATVIFVP